MNTYLVALVVIVFVARGIIIVPISDNIVHGSIVVDSVDRVSVGFHRLSSLLFSIPFLFLEKNDDDGSQNKNDQHSTHDDTIGGRTRIRRFVLVR